MATAPPRADRDVDQILRATLVPGIERVHFLGPFADRINFAAQQSRALNLAYALVEDKRVDANSVIAIVGAGVAGVTLAATLHLLGCTVHLIETRPTVLARQRNAKHRQLHPTVNQWPFDTDLSPTTAFPFFDWGTDICSDILATICAEFEELAGRDLANAIPRRLHLATEVTDRFPAGGQIALTTVPDRGLPLFDLVIYAVGFQNESQLSHRYPSYYWVEDSAEHDRDNDPGKRFAISGTGDGGLIDSIRLSFRGPPVGVLALRVATMLAKQAWSADGCEVSSLLATAEKEFRGSRRGPVEGGILATAYERAVAALPPAVVSELELHRVRDRTPAVYLVGQKHSLVEGAAAPIHKLIATYARIKSSIRYIRGKVKVARNGHIAVVPADPLEASPVPSPNGLIVRHGALNSLTKMFGATSTQLAALKGAQQNLADDFAEPIAEALARLGLDMRINPALADRTSEAFRQDRLRRLQGLTKIWPHITSVALNQTGFRVYSRDRSAWAPRRLFGLDVEERDAPLKPEL